MPTVKQEAAAPEYSHVGAKIPTELKRALQKIADETDRPYVRVVRRALRDFVENQKVKS